MTTTWHEWVGIGMSDRVPWHVAFDDTDSLQGMCTTYVGAVIAWTLVAAGARLIDFPRLIRHNPNVPKKTRGNGGVVLSALVPRPLVPSLERHVLHLLEKNAHLSQGANPGLIFLKGCVPTDVTEITTLVTRIGCELVSRDEIEATLERVKDVFSVDLSYHSWGTGDGLVGAFGALMQPLQGRNYTFELLTYRPLVHVQHSRDLSSFNVVKQLSSDFPTTIMNIDPNHQKVLIFPHGPDPVICGIRGTNLEDLIKFWLRLRNTTPLETMMLFRTNQHLDPHVNAFLSLHPRGKPLSRVVPHEVFVSTVVIASDSVTLPGRHVVILARQSRHEDERTITSVNDTTRYCWLAAYEPTKEFRTKVRQLTTGDVIRVIGSVRQVSPSILKKWQPLLKATDFPRDVDWSKVSITINLEEFKVLKLAQKIRFVNPTCPNCGKTLTSAGKSKGFKCKRCHAKFPSLAAITRHVPRSLVEGATYQVPPLALRHVNKPKGVHFFKPPECPRLPDPEWTSVVHRYLDALERLGGCGSLNQRTIQ